MQKGFWGISGALKWRSAPRRTAPGIPRVLASLARAPLRCAKGAVDGRSVR